jgi:hypothetical protein
MSIFSLPDLKFSGLRPKCAQLKEKTKAFFVSQKTKWLAFLINLKTKGISFLLKPFVWVFNKIKETFISICLTHAWVLYLGLGLGFLGFLCLDAWFVWLPHYLGGNFFRSFSVPFVVFFYQFFQHLFFWLSKTIFSVYWFWLSVLGFIGCGGAWLSMTFGDDAGDESAPFFFLGWIASFITLLIFVIVQSVRGFPNW